MPDAPPPATPQHPVEITASAGPWGGPIRTYRGARIEANDEAVFGLFLPGHPLDGSVAKLGG